MRRAHKLVAERRAERDRAFVFGDQLEPAARAHREIARVEIVDRALGGDRRQHAADEAHVVVERQPRDAAVVRLDVEAVVDHRLRDCSAPRLGDHHAARKAGAARGVLQIGGFGGAARLQLDLLLGQPSKSAGVPVKARSMPSAASRRKRRNWLDAMATDAPQPRAARAAWRRRPHGRRGSPTPAAPPERGRRTGRRRRSAGNPDGSRR